MTCDVDIHVQRAGYQRYASELNLIIVSPDTSPRGAGVDGEEGERNLGTGAGFYLDATEEKWKKHYIMYSYVVEEVRIIFFSLFYSEGPFFSKTHKNIPFAISIFALKICKAT